MSDVTERTLHLLSLLQSRAVWSGEELAVQLGVTARSVRRDVERLRRMGYPVHAAHGSGGGYRLGAGRALPPLLLGADEAAAVAVGLRLAAACSIDGLGEQALRALTALEQVLPPAARAEVTAVTTALEVLPSARAGIPGPTLVILAGAVRDGVEARLDYERADGHRSTRRVEPYRVLTIEGRWYLFAWDLERADWRTFRLDRMHEARASTFRFAPRPTPDIEAHVRAAVARGGRAGRVIVRFSVPAAQLRPRIPPTAGTVEADGEDACLLHLAEADLRWVAMHLAHLGLPVEVIEPAALTQAIAELGEWFDRARGVGAGTG